MSASSPSRKSRSPASNGDVLPQPATSSSSSCSSPAEDGALDDQLVRACALAWVSSSARMDRTSSAMSMPTGRQAMQRPQPTQPERVELVDARCELVREPLAVAGARRRTRVAAVQYSSVLGSTESQLRACARRRRRRARSVVLDVRAEARRADERAVAAAEAPLGDVVPDRALEVPEGAGRGGRSRRSGLPLARRARDEAGRPRGRRRPLRSWRSSARTASPPASRRRIDEAVPGRAAR